VFETADRITVLRLGRAIGVYNRRETTQQAIVEAITAGVPTKVAGVASPGGAAE
jgi:ABC-type sugar transport system ATPase subunit